MLSGVRYKMYTTGNVQGVPIKTSDFDFITVAVFFGLCNIISYGCEAELWILTNFLLILSGHLQIGDNRLNREIAFLRM